MKLDLFAVVLAASLALSGCSLPEVGLSSEAPDLAGRWANARGQAISIVQSEAKVVATMDDSIGRGEWTEAEGQCADFQNLSVTMRRGEREVGTRRAVVRSDVRRRAQTIEWTDGDRWQRADAPTASESAPPTTPVAAESGPQSGRWVDPADGSVAELSFAASRVSGTLESPPTAGSSSRRIVPVEGEVHGAQLRLRVDHADGALWMLGVIEDQGRSITFSQGSQWIFQGGNR